jgi:threonyl-tRNA synthetase
VIIPIADRHIEAAAELAGVLRARGLRIEVDGSDNRMQNKIRIAQEQKVPYMIVLGDREIEAREGTLRRRGAEKGEPQETLGWDALADRLSTESVERRVE